VAGTSMFSQERILAAVIPLIYGKARIPQLIVLGVLTLIFGWSAAHTRVDAGFDKSVPLEHPYMQVYKQYQDDFGGANTVLVALIQKEGDIYNEKFLTKLKNATDEVFFLPGVDRSRVSSLFTPDVRFIEVVEGGFRGGNVIPAEYQPNQEMFDLVRGNVGKAGIIGRYTTEDQRGAMIFAELLEVDPITGKKLDYQEVARLLEEKIRAFQDENTDVHILGFAKVIGDVTDAANEVVGFFFIALGMTWVLLVLYLGSVKLSLLPLLCAFVAVIWEFGLLTLTGFGIDPFAILVPFLVLSVSVSHGVQYSSSWVSELAKGRNGYDASLETFKFLAIPGTTALITDLAGFLTILLIPIGVIREMALNASYGMFAIIVTNKILMPILLTYQNVADVQGFVAKQERREAIMNPLFRLMAKVTRPVPAAVIILGTAAVLGFARWKAQDMKYGDSQAGVPELRPDSRYNNDSNAVQANFAIGTDIMKVIAEADPEACIHYEVMEQIDRFGWRLENTEGVSSIASLPWAARKVNAAFSEANPSWKVLPRNRYTMVQAITPLPTSTGFLNPDCSAMPILLFMADHKATTIQRAADAVEQFNRENSAEFFETHKDVDPAYCEAKTAARREAGMLKERGRRLAEKLKAKDYTDEQVEADAGVQKLRAAHEEALARFKSMDKVCPVNFALATGQVGVMGAQNQVVHEKDEPIVITVYIVILVFLWLSYRNLSSIVSIVFPLFVVSAMISAMMAIFGIGMKVATLPVAALAVGIGVDYGIYIYSTIDEFIHKHGKSLEEAYYETLRMTGKAVLFTGLVLTLSVTTWLWSGLQFQADMGALLAFAFFANMIGALFGCPALCRYFKKLPHG
jgi:uncharacterized protein